MINSKKITILLIIAASASLVGWDIYVGFFNQIQGDTISEIIMTWGVQWPILTFWFGILGGHWFWPIRKRKAGFLGDKSKTILIPLGFSVLLMIYEVSTRFYPILTAAGIPFNFAVYFFGVLSGHLFWFQIYEGRKS